MDWSSSLLNGKFEEIFGTNGSEQEGIQDETKILHSFRMQRIT
jgi:hypothetical protein